MMDWSPIFISMKTASVSILITFFVGLIVAWGIVKMKNDTIKIVLDGIFTLPIVLPPTVVGFFLLYIFGVRGPIGSFFIDFSIDVSFLQRSIRTGRLQPIGCGPHFGNV